MTASTESDFVEVATLDDVPDPGSMLVEVDERLIVLVRAAGHVYALDDICTHDGGPLSDGAIDAEDKTIACPRHGAKFGLEDGAARTMPATKPTIAHETKVVEHSILVRLKDRVE